MWDMPVYCSDLQKKSQKGLECELTCPLWTPSYARALRCLFLWWTRAVRVLVSLYAFISVLRSLEGLCM